METEILEKEGSISTEEGIINFHFGPEKNIIFFSREKVLNDWKKNKLGKKFFLAKDNF